MLIVTGYVQASSVAPNEALTRAKSVRHRQSQEYSKVIRELLQEKGQAHLSKLPLLFTRDLIDCCFWLSSKIDSPRPRSSLFFKISNHQQGEPMEECYDAKAEEQRIVKNAFGR